jgi:hypothetical protein
LSATGKLDIKSIEFILKQCGYRFAIGSLRNAVSRSISIEWHRGYWIHPTGVEARRRLRGDLLAVPVRQMVEFDEIIERLAETSRAALIKREEALDSAPFMLYRDSGIDWTKR